MMGGLYGEVVTPALGQVSDQTQSEPRIELHGWDCEAQAWHGPDEILFKLNGARSLLQKLRRLQGSWHGKLRAQPLGNLPLSFCASIYDLGDAGLATIDLEGSPAGPLAVSLVVPAQRRAHLRPEFAFEFVSFLRFLEGHVSSGAELPIHDYVQRVLTETAKATTLVFAVETRPVEVETEVFLHEQVERLTMGVIAWMGEKDASSKSVVS